MNLLQPNTMLWIWQLLSLAFLGLVVVALIKLVIVLFKADRFINEARAYMKHRK